ncbi:Protein of unknown function [Pyronema omphalodes CBS 100304]|uniref:Uncharacterized protein n=1 Tax=Pyronema omphalodes (strain CBS 100304) TaxID=1076935 RepID=U4LGI0_PYROM|nr:Protein of unknown function [Pyronema omphalodes CBS 100304]
MDMNNMNMEQFDALLVNQAVMDHDLMQFLKSFDDREEQPQEQLFTLPTDEFDATGLPNSPAGEFDSTGLSNHPTGEFDPAGLSNLLAGPELQPLQPTEPLLAVPENTAIPSELNLETTLYTSLNTYLQNAPQTAPVQHYQPISQPQPRRPSVKPPAPARPASPPIIADNYQAPARPLTRQYSSTPNPYHVSRQPHQGHQAYEGHQVQQSQQSQQSIYAAAQPTPPTQPAQYPINRYTPRPQLFSYQNQPAPNSTITVSPPPAQPILKPTAPIKPPNLTVREWLDLIDIEDQLFMSEFMPPKLKALLLKDQARYQFKIKNGYFDAPVTPVVPPKPPVPAPIEARPGSPLPRLEDCISSDWGKRLARLQAWKTLTPVQQRDLLKELKETCR